jgi:hypothetical protein
VTASTPVSVGGKLCSRLELLVGALDQDEAGERTH